MRAVVEQLVAALEAARYLAVYVVAGDAHIAQLDAAITAARTALEQAPQGVPALEPTPEMIDAGAQRLVSFEDGSVWPDSWSPLQVAAARNEAERVWRSMWLAAAPPAPPAPQTDEAQDAARFRWFAEHCMRDSSIRVGMELKACKAWAIAAAEPDLRAAIDAAAGFTRRPSEAP